MRVRRRPKLDKVRETLDEKLAYRNGYHSGLRFALSLLPEGDEAVSSAALRVALEDRIK